MLLAIKVTKNEILPPELYLKFGSTLILNPWLKFFLAELVFLFIIRWMINYTYILGVCVWCLHLKTTSRIWPNLVK